MTTNHSLLIALRPLAAEDSGQTMLRVDSEALETEESCASEERERQLTEATQGGDDDEQTDEEEA